MRVDRKSLHSGSESSMGVAVIGTHANHVSGSARLAVSRTTGYYGLNMLLRYSYTVKLDGQFDSGRIDRGINVCVCT